VSAWSEPIILGSRLASELGARLSRLGVEPRVRFAGAGRMSYSVLLADLPVLQAAMDDLSRTGAALPVVVDPLFTVKRDHLNAWSRASIAIGEEDTSRVVEPWLSKLDPAQAIAVNAMLEPGLLGFCLFDEQGTGKTYMGLGLVHSLIEAGRVSQVLVFCPASMLGTWEREFEKLPFLSSRVRGKQLVLKAGEHQLNIPSAVKVVITNYRQAVTRQNQLSNWATRLERDGTQSRTIIILDESFIVKNEEAQASAAVMSIRRACSYCLVLCGTPAPNRPDDIVHQINLSDLGSALGEYRSTEDQVEDLRRLSVLIEDRAAFLRRLKKDVLESLPQKVFKIKRLEMSKRHRSLYDRGREAFRNELLELGRQGIRRSYASALSGRARLIQLCSYPSAEELAPAENTKFEALREIIKDVCVERGRKLIIWTSYLDSVSSISEFITSIGLSVEVITGEVLPADRTSTVLRFQEAESPQVLVCNPAAAGAGLTLTRSADAVYMSYPSQAAHFLQSLDRIHRRGQEAAETNFHFLVFGNTIEDRELARLYRKEETQAELLGDIYQLPKTIEEFLAEIDA
jgi:SNF2 family DNA or RNA helicase